MRIFWFYVSGKNGSVFKTIPEINRKKFIRIEQQNLMFSLRYYTKPKSKEKVFSLTFGQNITLPPIVLKFPIFLR